MSGFASPEFYSTTLFILGFLSTPINLFGTYCILFKTPDSMKSVKWTMLNVHFCCSSVDFSISVIVQPYYLEETWAWIPLGIGNWLGVHYIVQVCVVGTMFIVTGMATIALFENQFYLIFAEGTWWRFGRFLFLGTNYLLAIIYTIPLIQRIPEQSQARAYLFQTHPQFLKYDSVANPIIVLVAHDDKSMGVRQLLMTSLILVEGIFIPAVLSWKMRNIGKDSKLTESTMRLKKRFLKRIYVQVSLPLLAIMIPSTISILSGVLGITPQSINNLVHICFSIHGLSSTLIMVSIHKPYREFCLKILRPQYLSKRITVSNSMTTFEPRTTVF